MGDRHSQAREQGSAVIATVDLAKYFNLQWQGEMRTRRLNEFSVAVAIPVGTSLFFLSTNPFGESGYVVDIRGI